MPVLELIPEKRTRQLRKLTEVSRALTYAVSLNEVLNLTVLRAAEILEAGKAILMLTDEEGLLAVRAAHGIDLAVCEGFHEPLRETLSARLQSLLGDSQSSFLGVPLVVTGEVTGLLAVGRQSGSPNLEEDEWLLSALADQASIALEKTRLDEHAEFRERLIGIVSHDLRNPVSVILSATSILMRREQFDEQAINMSVVRIQRSAERANRMIRDLLDFTQARLGGGIKVRRKPADLHAIARQVVEEFQGSHPERRIELTHEGDAEGHWDADRLAQGLGNLISNAIQYSPAYTVVRVEVRSVDADGISFAVHNDGPPICPEQRRRLFEPMQRTSAELNNASRSVGLGLYIVRHLVEAHDGRVSVESSEGNGTTFKVELPRRASILGRSRSAA